MSRKVIIIGAGIAGLCCAKRLISSGFDVSIFEKSRGIGGRLASRRIDNGIFNHGAASLPDFRKNDDMPKFLKYLLEKAVSEKILIPQGSNLTSYASMKTFTSYISKDVDIQKDSEIIGVTDTNRGAELEFRNDYKLQVKDNILIFAIPQPQVLALIQDQYPKISDAIKPAHMHAAISGLFAFNTAILTNQTFLENANIFGFHENARMGQILKLDCWTIHSKKSYGIKWSHLNKNEIKELLYNDFKNLVAGCFPQLVYSAGHRWLYGFTEKALNENFIFDDLGKIGICGDWCLGTNVLDAAISGTMLAEEIVSFSI